jgi:hypothetical protein
MIWTHYIYLPILTDVPAGSDLRPTDSDWCTRQFFGIEELDSEGLKSSSDPGIEEGSPRWNLKVPKWSRDWVVWRIPPGGIEGFQSSRLNCTARWNWSALHVCVGHCRFYMRLVEKDVFYGNLFSRRLIQTNEKWGHQSERYSTTLLVSTIFVSYINKGNIEGNVLKID